MKRTKKRNQVTKQMFKSTCAVMLTLALTVTNINVSWLQNEKEKKIVAESVIQNINEKEEIVQPEVVKEIKKERTENTKTYLLSDGSKKMEIFADAIRYKEDGKWKDYDASLTVMDEAKLQELKASQELAQQQETNETQVLSEQQELVQTQESNNTDITNSESDSEYKYTNAQGKYKHYFAENISEDTPVIMTNNDYEISFAPAKKAVNGESVAVQKISEDNDSEIVYANVDESIKYEYISLTNGVKESIVLSRKPESNIFEFSLELSGMNAELDKETKQIYLIDKETEEVAAVIAAPNIINRTGMPDYDHVEYKLKEKEDGSYKLSVIVAEEYLNTTSYPITIDPTYNWVGDSAMDYGATMSVGGAASSVLNKANNITLLNSTSNKGRLYVKFNNLNSRLRGKYVYQSYFGTHVKNTAGSLSIGVSRVLEDWDETTLTWNNRPEISETMYAEETEFENEGYNNYIITDWAKEIASGEISDDYGIALSCTSEEVNGVYVNLYPLFYSGKEAVLYVYYKDVEEVDFDYDGSFEVSHEIEDNQVKLSWEAYSDETDEYDVYVRTETDFNYIGKTTELEYIVAESKFGTHTDIRVMAIEKENTTSFFNAENHLSNIISIEKFESTDTDEEGNEVTETVYEQTHFDTDGDGLEDGYEIWDLGNN